MLVRPMKRRREDHLLYRVVVVVVERVVGMMARPCRVRCACRRVVLRCCWLWWLLLRAVGELRRMRAVLRGQARPWLLV